MPPPIISVVVPNYNGRKLLEKNLPSLFKALEKSAEAYEVIIVDDCSNDDSVTFLTEHYPQINVIKVKQNGGFSAACNLGFRICNGKITCLANSDITFDIDYFSNAVKYFKDTNLFALKGPVINYSVDINQPINIEYYNRLYFKRGFIKIIHLKNDQPYNTKTDYILLGACFIADTSKLKQLHGFDEIYSPYYWEDSDLPLRAKSAGYNLQFAPDCKVWHQYSSTISTTQTMTKRRLISVRNKFIFTWRFLEGPQQWTIHIIAHLLGISLRWVRLDWKYYASLGMALKRKLTWQVPAF